MPLEMWVLYGTWILGYAIISALLFTEFKVLYQKPILTLGQFIEEVVKLKTDAMETIQAVSNLAALDQAKEKYLSYGGIFPDLAAKIKLIQGEDHPEARVDLKNTIRSIRSCLREKRDSLIPLSDQQVIDRILNSPHRDLVTKIPYLKQIEGNKPIAELQDGLYHKVIYEKESAEDLDPSEPKEID